MKAGSLNTEQIIQLQKDKRKGKSPNELMSKYGIAKTSFYKYLKTDPMGPREDPEEDAGEDPEAESEDEVEPEIELVEEDEDDGDDGDDEDEEQELGEEEIDGSDDYLHAITSNPKAQKQVAKKEAKVKKAPKLKAQKEPKSPKKSAPKKAEDHSMSEEKEKLISKIVNYTEQFRDKLVIYIPIKGDKYGKYISNLYKKSEGELVHELDFIRGKITNTNTKTAYKLLYKVGTEAIETSGPMVGLNLQGLSDELNRSNEIDQVLTELSCEYSFNKYMDPRFRLMAHTGFTILKVDSMNKRKVLMEKSTQTYDVELKDLADDNLKEKYVEI